MKTFLKAAVCAVTLAAMPAQAGETEPMVLDLQGEALDHAMRFGDPAAIPAPGEKARAALTLFDREMGRARVDGVLSVSTEGRVVFAPSSPMPFEPGPGTAMGFASPGDPSDPADARLIVFTGRWVNFFGARLCPGQVFILPGEAQCI